MRKSLTLLAFLLSTPLSAQELIVNPDAFQTLVNPNCSHCRDEAKRRATDLRPNDPALCWIRGYSDGGIIPQRFFLNAYRVISDTYGVFVHDPEAGYSRGFAPSLEFAFHGWRNGVMVMKRKDGTLYSCLTGLAFDGPKKGEQLKAVPTLTSQWGAWHEAYPQAVAYHMFDKYQPVEMAASVHPDSLKSRGPADKRLPAETPVLGVVVGDQAKAYPLDLLAKAGLIHDEIAGQRAVIFWHEPTKTAAAYQPIATPPKKVDAKPRTVTLERDPKGIRDRETGSRWDIAGRAVSGELKGWTLDWLDGTQVKWFAWAAELPKTTIHAATKSTRNNVKDAIKEIAGSAEFLRSVPKKFATFVSADAQGRVRLKIDGDKEPTDWSLTPDAEIKIRGWWGRVEQIEPGKKVWAWFKVDRSKKPVGVFMLADELSQQDINGGAQVKTVGAGLVLVGPKKAEQTIADAVNLPLDRGGEKCCESNQLKSKDVVFVETKDGAIVKLYDVAGFEKLRVEQKTWLRDRWMKDGLPATVGVPHVYSGEVDVVFDHEAMRWARSLTPGAKFEIAASPPIKAVVKSVAAQREKTQTRLVIHSLDLAELNAGQRILVKMSALDPKVEADLFPPDIDRPKTREERIEWFLANIYCTCGVAGDRCTGHFYTLASCNPNGCAAPNATRQVLGSKIDAGMTNRHIFQELHAERGAAMLRPHLLP